MRVSSMGLAGVGRRARRGGATALFVALLLSACGGGGGGGETEDPTQGEFSGTAAMGHPVANGTLELRCASGTRTATTGPDGRYRVQLERAQQLPCVMIVRDGTVAGQPNTESMAGVLLRLGGVANVTPWTHLVAARLLGGEPNNALRTTAASELTRLLSEDKVAQARAFVREQLAKVLGNSPSADIDPIGTAFEAVPGNGMDDLVSAIYRGLFAAGKSLSLAAQEMSLNGLEMYYVPTNCRAGVLTGFTGSFNDVMVQTPYRPPPSGALGGTESFGGTADADSGGGGDGAGVGGSLGQFLRTKVEVRRADGSLLGTATTDNEKGMVTLVTCDYRGPLRITLRGDRDDATYYDEARKLNVSFAGRSMCAVLPGRTKNIGVTPLTNAACAYLDELVKTGTPATGRAAWADDALIEKANAAALKAYNDHAGPNFRLDDITRLPVVIGQQLDQQQDVLGFDQNGIYAAVLAGLVQSAARYDPTSASPALAFTDQLARDLTDGALDHRAADGQSAFGGALPSYLVDQMAMQTRSDTSGNALRLGDAALRSAGTAVVKSIFSKWHQENNNTPFFPIIYNVGAALRGDGSLVVKIVREAVDTRLARLEYPDMVTPAGVRIVDFRFIPPTDAQRVTVTPATIIALSDKGEVYTLTGFEFDWTLAFGVQSKVVDVIPAPWRIGRTQVSLTSDGKVQGEEIETKLPAGVRFESIGVMGFNSLFLIDADRTLGAFIVYTDRFETQPAGRRGRYVPLTPFRGLRAKMVGGAGNIRDAGPTSGPAAEEGQLLVLDMAGRLWIGAASQQESNAGTARQVAGLADVCYVHVWYVVACNGTLSSLHDPALPPLRLETPLLPGLSRTWRVFSGAQEAGQDEVTRAVSHTGCIYEIRYLAATGWRVTPDAASRPRADCVSPQWNGNPVTFVR